MPPIRVRPPHDLQDGNGERDEGRDDGEHLHTTDSVVWRQLNSDSKLIQYQSSIPFKIVDEIPHFTVSNKIAARADVGDHFMDAQSSQSLVQMEEAILALLNERLWLL